MFAASADLGTAAIYVVRDGVWTNASLCSSADPVAASESESGGVGEARLSGLASDSWVHLKLEATEEGKLIGSYNDRVVCMAHDATFSYGSAGLWASGAVPSAAFKNLRVSRHDPECGGSADRTCYDTVEGGSCALQCDAGYAATGTETRKCMETSPGVLRFDGTSIGCMLKPPLFPVGTIQLYASESLVRGDAVGVALNATVDEGSGLTIIYEIMSGNDDGIFEIDGCSGQVILARNGALDYEDPAKRTFTILVDARILGSPQSANASSLV